MNNKTIKDVAAFVGYTSISAVVIIALMMAFSFGKASGYIMLGLVIMGIIAYLTYLASAVGIADCATPVYATAPKSTKKAA